MAWTAIIGFLKCTWYISDGVNLLFRRKIGGKNSRNTFHLVAAGGGKIAGPDVLARGWGGGVPPGL